MGKMKLGICFSCCEYKALTGEHIIPQALGGKLYDYIYCKDCNDKFGWQIDSELIKNTHYFSTALNIKRDRGKNKPYEVTLITDGTKLVFDGNKFIRKYPKIIRKMIGDKLQSLDIRARSKEELEKIISGFKNKFNLDDDVETKIEYIPGPIETEREFLIDNSLIRRAIAKISYSFICIKLPNPTIFSPHFDDIRNYMRFGNTEELVSTNYLHTGFMSDNIRPLHKIHISLNKRDNLIVGFVSLFSTFRYTVLLSSNFRSVVEWSGLDYTFNPVTSKEICGNDHFIAPELSIKDILSPKQSKKLVESELIKGHKTVENYVNDHQLLTIEAES